MLGRFGPQSIPLRLIKMHDCELISGLMAREEGYLRYRARAEAIFWAASQIPVTNLIEID
jgi:hypothetical protein